MGVYLLGRVMKRKLAEVPSERSSPSTRMCHLCFPVHNFVPRARLYKHGSFKTVHKHALMPQQYKENLWGESEWWVCGHNRYLSDCAGVCVVVKAERDRIWEEPMKQTFQIYHTGAARHYNLERNEIHLEVRRSQNWDCTTRWNWERWGINKKQTIANCLWDRRTAALAAWKLYEPAQVCSRVYKRLRSRFMRPARCHLCILTLIQKKKYFEYIWTVQQEMCQNGVTLGNKTAFLLRDGETFKDRINWLPLLLSILCVRLDPGVFATEQSCFKLQSHGLVMMLLPCLVFRMTKSRMHTSGKNVETQSFYLRRKIMNLCQFAVYLNPIFNESAANWGLHTCVTFHLLVGGLVAGVCGGDVQMAP